jgi:hypothetical protein
MSEHTKLPENTLTIRPSEGTKISIEEISNVLKAYQEYSEAITHKDILGILLASIERINFKKVVLGCGIEDELKQKHYIVIAIEQTLKIAKCNNWPICNNNSFI